MALEIWLKGDYDFGALFTLAGSYEHFEKRSECDQGRFTFHLRNVTDVTYQIYSGGRVRILGDDFSDPATLVQIIWDAATIASGRPPMFQHTSIRPLDKTSSRIAWPLFKAEMESDANEGFPEAVDIVKAEVAKAKAVLGKLKELSGSVKRSESHPQTY